MDVLDYNIINEIGVEVTCVKGNDAYEFVLDPRLKLNVGKKKIKAKKLKPGMIISSSQGDLNVATVFVHNVTFFSFFKVQHKYPFIKYLREDPNKTYSKKDLQDLLNKSDYKYAMSLYDGISLETSIPGYSQYLPGAVLVEDKDELIMKDAELESFVEM